MKFFIALAVLAIGIAIIPETDAWWGFYRPWGYWGGYSWGWPYYRYYRDTMSQGNIQSRIQCRYIHEREVLSCTASSGVVDCGVVANFTGLVNQRYELYGLGREIVVEKQPIELVRYNLYPRMLDNSAWLNSTISVENKDVCFSLYHSFDYSKYYGYRVVDLQCYERLVNMFRAVESYETVTIRPTVGTVPFNVSFIGEILYVNKVQA